MVAQPTRVDGVWHKAVTERVHLHKWRQTFKDATTHQHLRTHSSAEMHIHMAQARDPTTDDALTRVQLRMRQ